MVLSPLIRYGTSIWTYEGWQGQVYTRQYAKSRFAQECLGEYCQYQHQGEPLFRTVGNDATFYRPPTAAQLQGYVTQIPKVLAAHGIAHVHNHWSYMPSLADQHQQVGGFTTPFTVLRLLTPLKMIYEAAKKRAEPYKRIVEELPEIRRDTVALIKKAGLENRRVYVLVNNRSEGNAPLTIKALVLAYQQLSQDL